MTAISQSGLAAAIKAIRAEIAKKTTWMVNYNDQISDAEMRADMTIALTAYLNAAQPHTPPPKGP
jgi:hypothetical protein